VGSHRLTKLLAIELALILAAMPVWAQTTVLPKTTVLPLTTLLVGSGGGSNPPTGMAVWYRGDSQTCSGGCTGTNVVTGYTDKSPNLNGCTMTGSPTYVASAVNGQPGTLFVAASTQYCTFNSPLAWTGAETVFVVWKNTNTTTESTMTVGSATYSLRYWSCNGTEQGADNQSVAQIGQGNAACDTSFHQMGMTYNSSTGVANFYIASTTDGTATNSQPLANAEDTVSDPGLAPANGILCEILIYPSVLSSGDITTMQSYLHGRYGL